MTRRKGSYGLDAPALFARRAAASLALAGAALFSVGSLPGAAGALAAGLLAAGAVATGAPALSTLHASWAGKRRLSERVLDLARPRWRGDERCLDIGCGRGLFLIGMALRLRAARGRRGRAVGVDVWSARDLSRNRVASLRRNARVEGVEDVVEVATADARSLPFASASFDVVVSSLAIHNICEGRHDAAALAARGEAVAEAIRVLKPGGFLSIFDILDTVPEYADVLRGHAEVDDVWLSGRLPVLYLARSRLLTARRRAV